MYQALFQAADQDTAGTVAHPPGANADRLAHIGGFDMQIRCARKQAVQPARHQHERVRAAKQIDQRVRIPRALLGERLCDKIRRVPEQQVPAVIRVEHQHGRVINCIEHFRVAIDAVVRERMKQPEARRNARSEGRVTSHELRLLPQGSRLAIPSRDAISGSTNSAVLVDAGTADLVNATLADWVLTDAESSPCIDAGDNDARWQLESEGNGRIIDLCRYGGTAQASRTFVVKSSVLIAR